MRFAGTIKAQVQLLGQAFGGQHSTGMRGNGYNSIPGFIEKHIGK